MRVLRRRLVYSCFHKVVKAMSLANSVGISSLLCFGSACHAHRSLVEVIHQVCSRVCQEPFNPLVCLRFVILPEYTLSSSYLPFVMR